MDLKILARHYVFNFYYSHFRFSEIVKVMFQHKDDILSSMNNNSTEKDLEPLSGNGVQNGGAAPSPIDADILNKGGFSKTNIVTLPMYI